MRKIESIIGRPLTDIDEVETYLKELEDIKEKLDVQIYGEKDWHKQITNTWYYWINQDDKKINKAIVYISSLYKKSEDHSFIYPKIEFLLTDCHTDDIYFEINHYKDFTEEFIKIDSEEIINQLNQTKDLYKKELHKIIYK